MLDFKIPMKQLMGVKFFVYLAKSSLARGLTEADTGHLWFPCHFFVLGVYRLMHTCFKIASSPA